MTRKDFFWPNMEKEVAEYLARCMECQQVKFEHQYPAGLLQALPTPKLKWEIIIMDLVTGLPNNVKNHNSIMVIVDKISKDATFFQ